MYVVILYLYKWQLWVVTSSIISYKRWDRHVCWSRKRRQISDGHVGGREPQISETVDMGCTDIWEHLYLCITGLLMWWFTLVFVTLLPWSTPSLKKWSMILCIVKTHWKTFAWIGNIFLNGALCVFKKQDQHLRVKNTINPFKLSFPYL